MNTQEAILTDANGARIQIHSFRIEPPSHLHIKAETPQMGIAVAFALFNFSTDQVRHFGYNIEQFGPLLANVRKAYVSPTPRSELSRFTETVSDEISIGAPLVADNLLDRLCRSFRLEPLQARPPERLSGGETAKVILTAHLVCMPDVIILDRVLDEFDRNARTALHSLLRDAEHPMVVVTTGSIYDSFPPDIEITVDHQRVELRTQISPSETTTNETALSELTIKTESLNSHDSHPLAIVNGLTVMRANREILSNITLTIKSGDLCWLLGPNGCGKSTLMEALCGLLQTVSPTEFRSLGGREFQVKSNLANVAAYAPQDPEGDVTELTLLEEVRLARKTTHRNGMAETAIETWLDSLGVSENQWNFPLSDDVQNRKLASVLAAFARNRPIVLLDEPTLFLDSSGRKTISKAIISHLSRGGAVISATHDSLFRRILFQSQRKIIK